MVKNKIHIFNKKKYISLKDAEHVINNHLLISSLANEELNRLREKIASLRKNPALRDVLA